MSTPNPVRARLVVIGALTALSVGAVAHADDRVAEVSPPTTVIGYSDLDLSKEADSRELYTRLRRASSRVCDQHSDIRDLRMKRLYVECYQETLARAVSDVDNATVKAAFATDDQIHVAQRSGTTRPRT